MSTTSNDDLPEISYDAENKLVNVVMFPGYPKPYPLAEYLEVLDMPTVRQFMGGGLYAQDAVYFFGRSTYQGRELARQLPNFNFATGDGHAWIDLLGSMVYINDTQAPKPSKDLPSESLRLRLGKKDLQVLFVLLVEPELLNASQSLIAEAACVSQATASRSIRQLESFLKASIGSPAWYEMQEYLFDYWVERYLEKLRPKLDAARYRPLWSLDQIPAPPVTHSLSGAAALVHQEDYLANASVVDLYGDTHAPTLMKSFRIVPDLEGNVIVREKFWELKHDTIVPNLLVYADLMATGEPRDLDAAQIVRKRLLEKASS